MKLENQVSNLELSQKLEKLEVKQESLFCWQYFNDINDDGRMSTYKLYYIDNLYSDIDNGYSAFTVAELGELLKSYIKLIKKHIPSGTKDKALFYDFFQPIPDANIYAKMLIYLIVNKIKI